MRALHVRFKFPVWKLSCIEQPELLKTVILHPSIHLPLFLASFSICQDHTLAFFSLPGKYCNCSFILKMQFVANCTETFAKVAFEITWGLKILYLCLLLFWFVCLFVCLKNTDTLDIR